MVGSKVYDANELEKLIKQKKSDEEGKKEDE